MRIDDSISFIGEGGEHHPMAELLKRATTSTKARLEIHSDKGKLWIVAANDGKIIFANSFDVTSEKDELYYLLAVCEHVEFNTSATDVRATGKVSEMVMRYFNILR